MGAKKKKPKKSPKRRRRKIPPATETQILTQCKYRCCLCYAHERDTAEKLGQIAHIDKNPANNGASNLAFLCHDHHSKYDGKSLQSKGITEGVLRAALEDLFEYHRLQEKKSVTITLTLNRDFDSFSDSDCAELLAEIASIAKSKGGFRKLAMEPGSVKIQLELTGEDAARVLASYRAGQLTPLSVTSVDYARGTRHFEIDDQFNAHLGVPTSAHVSEVMRNPDYVQDLASPRWAPSSRLAVKDEFPKKGLAILAIVTKGEKREVVDRGILIPKGVLASAPVSRPVDLLRAFADRFGIPLPGFNNEKLVLGSTKGVLYGDADSYLMRLTDFRRPEALLCSIVVHFGSHRVPQIMVNVCVKVGEAYAAALVESGYRIDIDRWKSRRLRPAKLTTI